MSAGFYLGFIVWGRSPYWPKATSFLGGPSLIHQWRALDSSTRTTRTRFSQYAAAHAREPTSFWWENVKAIVILQRILAKMSLWRKQDVTKFII